MCRSEWDFEGEPEEAKDDPAWQRLFGEEDSDQFGIRTALFVLALACFFAAVFFMARALTVRRRRGQSMGLICP
jgi:hypothetical protein